MNFLLHNVVKFEGKYSFSRSQIFQMFSICMKMNFQIIIFTFNERERERDSRMKRFEQEILILTKMLYRLTCTYALYQLM